MNMRHILTAFILTLTFFTSNIYADVPRSSWSPSSYSDTQAYVGAAFGTVNHDLAPLDEPNNLELLVGLETSETIAIEASYLDLGEAKFTFFGDSIKIAIDGFTLGPVARIQASPQIELQAKIGLFFWDAEVTETLFGITDKYGDDGSDIFFGFGGMAKINEQVSLGVRYNMYDIDGEDFSTLQAQIQFNIQ